MLKPTIVEIPSPQMGGKVWLLEDKGLFVLERGPGVLRTIACTHAGSGSLMAIDGVPDANGFFPDENMEEPQMPNLNGVEPARAESIMQGYLNVRSRFECRNGRPFYRATPIVMGSWMLDGGFTHGLTIRAEGGTISASAIASIVWMSFMRAEPPTEEK